jgi:NAD(P)-dependent dehydrogenase (short-subunit alcohol dehydrogenase family)
VVVVGGTGLIGKHLCRQLLESGYKVIIASRNELHGRSFEAFIARTPAQRKRLRFIAFDAALEPHDGRDRPMLDGTRIQSTSAVSKFTRQRKGTHTFWPMRPFLQR